MVQGMLAVSVFCMFGVGFYIAYKIDQFLDIIQETVKDKSEGENTSLKILFLNDISDDELLKEVHECKSLYKETEIMIFDRQAEEAEKILTITQSHDIISKTAEKGDRQDESEN